MNATLRDPSKKIKVDFERAPLKVRIKEKYLSLFFLKKVVWYLFRLILLIGVTYVVLFPFISKIMGSVMEFEDFADSAVILIPKTFTFDTYAAIWSELDYVTAFMDTFVISISCAVIQTIVCCLIGYGFAKFKFKGSKWIFLIVMLTMIVPHPTLRLSMLTSFKEFDLRDPISVILGGPGLFELIGAGTLDMRNTYFPFIILSLFGIAFKNGLYIFLLRQFFRGVPDELEESAYIDGSGVFKIFVKIILPLSIPMMITVFLFAFSWQWTDTFYTNLFISPNQGVPLLVHLVEQYPASLINEASKLVSVQTRIYSAITGTTGIMIIMPLVIIYAFCQKFLVQGIERSGLTAD